MIPDHFHTTLLGPRSRSAALFHFASLFLGLLISIGYVPVEAEPVRVATVEPFEELVRAWGEASGLEISVRVFPTNECIRRTGRGEFDLAVLTENLTAGQRQLLGARPGRVPQTYAVGWEAATLIAHPENPIPFLDEQQVRNLFSSKACGDEPRPIRAWNEIPGQEHRSSSPVGRIIPRLDTPEGVHLQEILLSECEFDEDAYQVSEDAVRERIVAASPEAIGVVNRLRYIGKARKLPILGAGGTQPATPESSTLNSGTYPFGRKIWLVTPRIYYDPEPAAKFIAFALSPEGQFEVARMGFFSME